MHANDLLKICERVRVSVSQVGVWGERARCVSRDNGLVREAVASGW